MYLKNRQYFLVRGGGVALDGATIRQWGTMTIGQSRKYLGSRQDNWAASDNHNQAFSRCTIRTKKPFFDILIFNF
jgi:hypothetical protein